MADDRRHDDLSERLRDHVDAVAPITLDEVRGYHLVSIAADADAWRPIAAAPIEPRADPAIAWTGSEMIVWGGTGDGPRALADGAAYDPAGDSWRVIAPSPLSARVGSGAAWTGSEVIVVGGRMRDGREINDSASYDPVVDTWGPFPSIIGPQPVEVAWTGTELIIVQTGGEAGDGCGFYHYVPAGDGWSLSSPTRGFGGGARGPQAWSG